MLGGARLRVGHSRERNCFAYVSSACSSTADRSQCIQILWRGKQLLLWVVNSAAVPEGQIWINPIHCRLLTLEEGVDIYVTPYSDVKILDELYIETDSPDDQEIVEQNAELLQLNLLDQLRLVVKNQKTVVWITMSLPIVFTPKQTGILVNHSMVVVKMDTFMHSPYKLLHSAEKLSQEIQEKNKIFNNLEITLDGLLKPYYNIPETLILRVFPIDGDGTKNVVHPFKVFMHEDLIPGKYNNGKIILANIEVIPSIVTDNKSLEDNPVSGIITNNPLSVEIIPIDNIVFKSLSHEVYNYLIPTALIPLSLNNILVLDKGDSLMLTFNCEIVQPEQIKIMAYIDGNQSEEEIIGKFKQCVVECTNAGNSFLLNDGVPVQQKQITNGVLTFKLHPEKLKFTVLKSESLRNCSVSAKCLDKLETAAKTKRSNNDIEYESRNYCRNIDCVEELVTKVLLHFEFEIYREARFKGASEVKGNILITGPSGSGKSSLCHILTNDMTFWSHTLQCRTLKGRKDVLEVLGKAILMCQEHSPAVLLCDDLDALVPPDTEGAAPQDIAYYNRLAVAIKYMLNTCRSVCVLMTAINVKSLHPVLREFSGRPTFTAHFEIPELHQRERQAFLNHLLNENIRNDFYIDEDGITRMAMATSGQTLRDLSDYVNRKIFKAVKKKYANPGEETPRLVEDVSGSSESKDDFDIWGALGGMEDVKRELTECIFWPMMYPALFPSQSCGILLFGPPGTGKSFIGSCLAKLANMNFLSVKGPELLSKYIGQSEKAVRDIFDKADMKRPCILFFDEFDSLAPKRGHDSTGVTDRVVNQLLVRLDGAEGGARGPVVAATSRPDLIDPALLRPGRLHKHIYCALPDKKGRSQILRTLSQSVNISERMDLTDIAERTDGFSPADLKALLVTAQLTCLEKKLEVAESQTPDSVIVQPEDVESALLETKPSLSLQQRLFYSMIYKRFRGEKLTNEEITEAQRPQQQRVTLA